MVVANPRRLPASNSMVSPLRFALRAPNLSRTLREEFLSEDGCGEDAYADRSYQNRMFGSSFGRSGSSRLAPMQLRKMTCWVLGPKHCTTLETCRTSTSLGDRPTNQSPLGNVLVVSATMTAAASRRAKSAGTILPELCPFSPCSPLNSKRLMPMPKSFCAIFPRYH
eukprot:807098-Rhodomonas_salina.5